MATGRLPPPVPTPGVIATTVHCPGEPGDTPRSCMQPLALPHEFSRVAFRVRLVFRTRIRKIR
ncbi:protein of unknown function [Methanoculleus bourgensis]|uniref:Uncharacterized protein n=1 Tax=Methanoculleus bourgensis TaxID=83986 RepID=A0A0X3BM04_9EURY|nr:protein of unknown function [Methanoculleus bourgensis]